MLCWKEEKGWNMFMFVMKGPLQIMTWCRGEEGEKKYLSDAQFLSQSLKQIISGKILHVVLIFEKW